ncbi:hypothetical protein Tco_1055096 [Tanacetum coccineum]|uniref:Reverse transcriptase zinc-binding domain-containing protein n=1 Tax=Tanacetum coccineum TaxID=301880 RepID=A0ABQ5GZ14_9ASTR
MFALEIHKSGPVCNFGFWEDGQWKWDVKFRRRLFDWEVDQFEAFSSLLNSMMLVTSNEDKVIWSIESSGKFSLKSFCYEVENMNYHGNPLLSSIWKFKAPPKARLICWQVLSGKFPIRDLLSNVHFRFLPYFHEVDIFLSSCSSHSIVHVHRECNSDADKLAKDEVYRTSPLSIWKDD